MDARKLIKLRTDLTSFLDDVAMPLGHPRRRRWCDAYLRGILLDGHRKSVESLAGHYSDFGCFRDTIARHLDASRFPTLMEYSDCDGEWALAEIPMLERELREIGAAFRKQPSAEPQGAFEHTAEHRVGAASLYDCFHNVSGENLFEAILELCAVARQHKRPITFM